MKGKKILPILLVGLLFLSVVSLPTPVQATNHTTIIDMEATQLETFKAVITSSHGESDTLRDQLVSNLTEMGFEVIIETGGINSTLLEDVDLLIMGSVYHGINFTDAEVNAVKNWFAESGKKVIWVSGDSDFSGDYIINNTNKMLEAVGSHLRVELCSVEDPDSNAGAGYRVVANISNQEDPIVASILTKNITQLLFHGPSILYGLDENNTPVALENTTLPNVHWIMKTGAAGVIVDHNPLTKPLAHEDNQNGSFVIAAMELLEKGAVFTAGAALYGDYQPIINDEYKGVPLNGTKFMRNFIAWTRLYLMDDKGPSITVTISPEEPTTKDTITIATSMYDVLSDVYEFEAAYSADGVTWTTIELTYNATLGKYVAEIGPLAEGTYYVKVSASDYYNNINEVTVTFEVVEAPIDYTMYILGGAAAIIVIVIIVGFFLMKKK